MTTPAKLASGKTGLLMQYLQDQGPQTPQQLARQFGMRTKVAHGYLYQRLNGGRGGVAFVAGKWHRVLAGQPAAVLKDKRPMRTAPRTAGPRGEWRPPVAPPRRPGADDFRALPSLMGAARVPYGFRKA